MYSARTNQLHEMYLKSLDEDFKKWLRVTVADDVQKYIKPTIRYVEFIVEQEYDDNDYFDAVTSINFYDADNNFIDLEMSLKPEYEDGTAADGVPEFYDLKYDAMGGVMDELKTLRLDDVLIDLEEIKNE